MAGILARSKVALAACAFLTAAMTQAPERRALPELPAAPVMADQAYPDCKDAYRERNLAVTRAQEATQCIARIDGFYAEVLAPFREQMLAHQQAIGALRDRVTGDAALPGQPGADGFVADAGAEFDASNPDGAHFAAYREAEARYRDDRAFLEERYCRYAGCEGYEPTAQSAERDAADGMQQCGDEPGNSIYFEGLVGALLNRARRMQTGTNITGTMVSIACRLRPEERQAAAEATDRAVAQEVVGATAQWVSPTRPEVSGSSTVTAMNSQPNGATCLDVSDVVIIDGEEALMTKRMCRAPGETRYILQS